MRAGLPQRVRFVVSICLILSLTGAYSAGGQSDCRVQYDAGGPVAPILPRSLDPAPFSPPGIRGSSRLPNHLPVQNTVAISSSMLRGIFPGLGNLQFGYLWSLADTYRQGLFTLDHSMPIKLTQEDVVFAETHWRVENPLQTIKGSPDPAVQALIGGGYRKRLSFGRMVGVNGFCNVTRLQKQWFSSGILGLEMAEVYADNVVLSLKLNYYGNVFAGRGGVFAAWAEGRGDYKMEAAYSRPLVLGIADFRLKLVGYKVDQYIRGYGGNLGVDISPANRAFVIRYEYGHDPISLRYHNINVAVNLSFESNKLLSGQNPFALPR